VFFWGFFWSPRSEGSKDSSQNFFNFDFLTPVTNFFSFWGGCLEVPHRSVDFPIYISSSLVLLIFSRCPFPSPILLNQSMEDWSFASGSLCVSVIVVPFLNMFLRRRIKRLVEFPVSRLRLLSDFGLSQVFFPSQTPFASEDPPPPPPEPNVSA